MNNSEQLLFLALKTFHVKNSILALEHLMILVETHSCRFSFLAICLCVSLCFFYL